MARIRMFLYHASLLGLALSMGWQLIHMLPWTGGSWPGIWIFLTANLLLFVFAAEAIVVYRADRSLERSSALRLLRFSVSRETDLYLWVLYSSLYFHIPIWISASPTLGSIFPLYDLGPVLGVTGACLFHSLVAYWLHRLSHKVPALWELHKIHHSATELTVINGPRDHLFLVLLQPLIFTCFFRGSALYGHKIFAFRALLLLLQHSKLDFRFGWLGLIFVSPHAHRIHHQKDPRYHEKNFSADISLWDQLFGTFLYEIPLSAAEIERNLGVPETEKGSGNACILWEMLDSTRRSFSVFLGGRRWSRARLEGKSAR